MFEDLGSIREDISNASKFQQWAFNELKRQVTYKATAEGITVETVHPAYTSQRWSETGCGFTHEDNREGDVFVCQKSECGKKPHSDYNQTASDGQQTRRFRRRETLHTDTSRTGASLVLEGQPITLP